jgi:hypothetical protein
MMIKMSRLCLGYKVCMCFPPIIMLCEIDKVHLVLKPLVFPPNHV